MSTSVDFNKRSLVVITGASQGIGQKISEFVGCKLKDNSKIVLIARSEKGLLETKNLIEKANKNLVVEIYAQDLSKSTIKDFELIFHEVLQTEECKEAYENAIIFHNAGQVGLLKNAVELDDLNTWKSYYELNLFSTTLLNSVFVTKCKKQIPKLYVINISSLCGHKPFVNLSLYGSAKAARDLYFSVLAVEEPNITVLKYCPGPVVTAMFNEIIENAQNTEIRSQFREMKDTKIALTTDQTVEKLLNILEYGKFKSGDLIDYFDV